jgi:predicted transcriptional regulator
MSAKHTRELPFIETYLKSRRLGKRMKIADIVNYIGEHTAIVDLLERKGRPLNIDYLAKKVFLDKWKIKSFLDALEEGGTIVREGKMIRLSERNEEEEEEISFEPSTVIEEPESINAYQRVLKTSQKIDDEWEKYVEEEYEENEGSFFDE